VIDRLTQLYLESNQFDRLMERLERERREAEKAREMTLCVAQALTTAGDLGSARSQLERLLTENTRDAHLLTQLVALCESEGDAPSAVKYQRQLVAAAPSSYDHQLRLAQLLTKAGEADEAADIWVKLVAGETEPHRNLAAIDQLMTAKKEDTAAAVLSRLLAQKPGNWELLYREGAALMARNKPDEAAAKFAAVLALKAPDDELGEATKHRIKEAKKKATAAPKPGQSTRAAMASRYDPSKFAPLARRVQQIGSIREAVGMDERNYGGGYTPPFWAPSDYGEARIASHGWLAERARGTGDPDAYLKGLKAARDKAGADPRPAWDLLYFHFLRNAGGKDLLPVAFELSRGPDPAGLLAYLLAVSSRTNGTQVNSRRSADGSKDTTPPLPPDQLEHLLACQKKLKQVRPDWADSESLGWVVLTELKRAKRVDEEKVAYREALAAATTADKVQSALSLAAGRDDLDTVLTLFAKLDQLQGPAKSAAQVRQLPTRQAADTFYSLMAKRAEAKKFPDVLRLADLFLATARRQNLAAPKTASSARKASAGSINLYFYGNKGLPQQVSLKYPAANEYYDESAVGVLYAAYALYKGADLSTDLTAHVRGQADAAQGAERLYLQLALGYLHWWADEKDEALARLAEAVRLAPADHGLLFEVAGLREEAGDLDAALALLDSVTPLDTQMMQRREEAALRLAERTGNLDRARQAADRLFGLRLDPEKQVELAAKMHRLGLPQMAEAVLGRAPRQAGNKTATLVQLMTQYQTQNQSDLAVQIARQLLRKLPPGSGASAGRRGGGTKTTASGPRPSGCWPGPASSRT
jgi:predicted Zn-dependent protease